MNEIRSNAEWCCALRAGGAPQAAALEDLRRYLLRALPNALKRHGRVPDDLVDDVVQETLLRVLDRLDDFEGRSRFTTWVVTIAARLAMTELRRRRWRDVSLDALVAEDPRIPGDLDPDPHAGPESRAARVAIVSALADAFEAELSPRQRAAIVSELHGMPQEEIGRRLGISRNAVYKLAYDGRKKLKRGLEASGFGIDDLRACFE
ncbi:MAG: sigma-70 family RNA polymerase sigma factor [Myxococcota bacterium]